MGQCGAHHVVQIGAVDQRFGDRRRGRQLPGAGQLDGAFDEDRGGLLLVMLRGVAEQVGDRGRHGAHHHVDVEGLDRVRHPWLTGPLQAEISAITSAGPLAWAPMSCAGAVVRLIVSLHSGQRDPRGISTMSSMARRMFELVEPIGVIPYAADEPNEAMFGLGFTDYWDTYFAGELRRWASFRRRWSTRCSTTSLPARWLATSRRSGRPPRPRRRSRPAKRAAPTHCGAFWATTSALPRSFACR